MKLLTSTLLLLLLAAGCTTFRNGAPPTKTEQALFTIQTNYVPAVTTVTNPPAAPGLAPVVVTTTNQQPLYTYTPSPLVTDIKDSVGAVVPGYGGLIGTGLGALAALWAWFRSAKSKAVGVNLAQSIETIREFVKHLPNGNVYDSALTSWLQQHQAETGTIAGVLELLQNDVSNPDAVVAAQQLRDAIAALNPSALPPKTPG